MVMRIYRTKVRVRDPAKYQMQLAGIELLRARAEKLTKWSKRDWALVQIGRLEREVSRHYAAVVLALADYPDLFEIDPEK